MTADGGLEERISRTLGSVVDAESRRMFGGVAYLIEGNMAVALMGDGDLLARVGPEAAARYADGSAAAHMVMGGGRPMPGWLRVSADAVATDGALREWIGRCVAFTTELPPRASRAR